MITSDSRNSAPEPDNTHRRPSLLLLSDAKLFRSGLATVLGDWPFRTIEAVEYATASRFRMPSWDIILLDIPARSDPDKLLYQACKFERIPRVVITDHFTFDVYAACLRARTSGFLLQEMPVPALRVSLFLILKGKKIWPTRQALASLASMEYTESNDQKVANNARKRGFNFTPREIKILRCLVQEGCSNKVIARKLGNTEATIKVHMKALLRKIGAQNRTQAAIWALTHGFGAMSFEATVEESSYLEPVP